LIYHNLIYLEDSLLSDSKGDIALYSEENILLNLKENLVKFHWNWWGTVHSFLYFI